MRRAIAVVRGCCQISAAQIGIRFRFRRQTQLQPASSSENSGQYTEKLGFGLQGNRRRVRPTRTKARAHRDAQFAEPPKMMPDQALLLGFGHWSTALLFVRGTPLQDKIGQYQQVMGDGHHGFGSRFGGNPPELVSQMAIFLGGNPCPRVEESSISVRLPLALSAVSSFVRV